MMYFPFCICIVIYVMASGNLSVGDKFITINVIGVTTSIWSRFIEFSTLNDFQMIFKMIRNWFIIFNLIWFENHPELSSSEPSSQSLLLSQNRSTNTGWVIPTRSGDLHMANSLKTKLWSVLIKDRSWTTNRPEILRYNQYKRNLIII